MKLKQFGYLCLDYFTRTWVAFWGTLVFCLSYMLWNTIGPKAYRFDPNPYLLLCMIITLLSYFQNIVIMTIQREDHEIQQRLEALEAERDKKQFDMIEDIFEEIVEEDNGIERCTHQEESPDSPPKSN